VHVLKEGVGNREEMESVGQIMVDVGYQAKGLDYFFIVSDETNEEY